MIITTRDRIRGVAKRWAEQYKVKRGPDAERWTAIENRLAALDVETATAADVKAIIGNDSWTDVNCDVCGKDAGTVVSMERPPSYVDPDFPPDPDVVACVCRACLVAALAEFDGHANTPATYSAPTNDN